MQRRIYLGIKIPPPDLGRFSTMDKLDQMYAEDAEIIREAFKEGGRTFFENILYLKRRNEIIKQIKRGAL